MKRCAITTVSCCVLFILFIQPCVLYGDESETRKKLGADLIKLGKHWTEEGNLSWFEVTDECIITSMSKLSKDSPAGRLKAAVNGPLQPSRKFDYSWRVDLSDVASVEAEQSNGVIRLNTKHKSVESYDGSLYNYFDIGTGNFGDDRAKWEKILKTISRLIDLCK